MFHFQIDLGQILIMTVIGVIGWMIASTVNRIYQTLDTHDKSIQDLVGKVNFLIGLAGWTDSSHGPKIGG